MRLAYPELHQPRQPVLRYYVRLAVLSEGSTLLKGSSLPQQGFLRVESRCLPRNRSRRDPLGSQWACSIETNITLLELTALS